MTDDRILSSFCFRDTDFLLSDLHLSFNRSFSILCAIWPVQTFLWKSGRLLRMFARLLSSLTVEKRYLLSGYCTSHGKKTIYIGLGPVRMEWSGLKQPCIVSITYIYDIFWTLRRMKKLYDNNRCLWMLFVVINLWKSSRCYLQIKKFLPDVN